MNHWQDILSEYPHTLHDDGHIAIDTTRRQQAAALLIPRTELTMLRATGGDWRKMLQGQATCDIAGVTPNQSLPGALCTPKGRMIANFHLLQDGDDALIITQRSTSEALLNTLGRFAPFFKVKLEQTDQPLLATLVHPESSAATLAALGISAAPQPGLVMHWQHGRAIIISGQQLLVTLENQPQEAWSRLSALADPAGTTEAILADIRDGQGWVTAATSDEFIPQMLALHHTGAVSFKKGCYTGQEVVARMQYLGKLKRHLYRIALVLEQAPAAGTPCYLPGTSQNCGHIVMSAMSTPGLAEALAVLTDEGAGSPSLQLGENDAAVAVRRLPLPFADEAA